VLVGTFREVALHEILPRQIKKKNKESIKHLEKKSSGRGTSKKKWVNDHETKALASS